MKRATLPLVLLLVAGGARSQDAPAPAAPTPPAAETPPPAAEAPAPAAKTATPEDDPYLTNYKKFEHRDERAPGRGPQGRKIGFGFALGRPLGFTTKVYFTQTIGFQADIGVTYGWLGPEVDIAGHVVWHPYTILQREDFKLSTYVGGGARGAWWPLMLRGIPDQVPHCEPKPPQSPTLTSALDPRTCWRPVFLYAPQGEAFPGTLGAQGVAGLDLQLQKFPLELYVQPTATLDLFPGLSADVGFQVGARWYFF
ncbi:MAG: hypothetical protein HY904_12395 [Deltaproteobacteria bacterium]|nr:hypothetical protein [Deltaproteobacteria bacterium]